MIVKKLIDVCKKHEAIYIYEGSPEQWLSDGAAIYPLFNLPHFDENTLCKTYDISDKKALKIHFKHENKLPLGLSFEDVIANENECEAGPIDLSYAGKSIVPYSTSQGIMFIDAAYLNPLSDIQSDLLKVYERYTESGTLYFAVKSGLMLVALIMPLDCITESLVKSLKTLYTQCEIALFNKQTHQEEATSVQQHMCFESEEKTINHEN